MGNIAVGHFIHGDYGIVAVGQRSSAKTGVAPFRATQFKCLLYDGGIDFTVTAFEFPGFGPFQPQFFSDCLPVFARLQTLDNIFAFLFGFFTGFFIH